MRVLILGGTRNLGPLLVRELAARGHRLAVCNRGRTPDDLPGDVERLRADRGDRQQLERALGARDFDGVVDTTLYTGPEAEDVVELLAGRVGHYVTLSSGQVYLCREGARRPYSEEDYAGQVMAEPPRDGRDWSEWRYGVDKRAAEDVLAAAVAERGFPATVLRLPMVHSERDHYQRLRNYLARLDDGGPILVPAGPHLPVRHVDGADVVRVIADLLESGSGLGGVYNLSQEETLPIEECLARLAEVAGRPLELLRPPRERLLETDLLPACSPFSGLWMSELDNRRSRRELGVVYTPFAATLERLVAHLRRQPPPSGYAQRPRELALAAAAPPQSRSMAIAPHEGSPSGRA
jgi:nucleoside-diphosphate-sugar epimerase